MPAQILTAHGGPELFSFQTVAEPIAKAGEVVVRLKATSVNQIDIKIRGGLPIGPALPAILGSDVAGIVESVGPGVDAFAPGDEVFGCAGGVKGLGGTLAEFIAADARLLARKPERLSWRETAALPLVAITAWEAVARTKLATADRVLVHGGTGGVGHLVVQLAKAKGAYVATTVINAEAARTARELGADQTIIFTEEEVADYVTRLTAGAGFDVVIDTVGGANLDKSFAAAALNGRIAATAARSSHDLSLMHNKGLTLGVIFMLIPMLHNIGRERHGAILAEIAALADSGKIRPLVDPTRFTLAQAGDAHRYLETGKAMGKVVIDIG